MRSIATLLATMLIPAAALAQDNSILARGDTQFSAVPGVISTNLGSNAAHAGFHAFDTCAPKQLVRAAGGLQATSRMVYGLYADQDSTGTLVLNVRRSTTGGRTWEAPVTVYTVNAAAGETFNSGSGTSSQFLIRCYENKVIALFLSNGHNTAAGDQAIQAVGSLDQGLTWSAPIYVSTGVLPGGTQKDVDEVSAAYSAAGLSVAWETDFLTNWQENIYYSLIDVIDVGGVPTMTALVAETAMTSFAPGTSDVDYTDVDAEGQLVHVVWNDDSDPNLPSGSQTNRTYSRTSLDGGVTFGPAFPHTPIYGGTWASPRRPRAQVDLSVNRVFTFMEDARLDQDDLWMDVGDVSGGTVAWNNMGVSCNFTPPVGAGMGDVDGFQVDADGGTIAILYADDSAGTPQNNSNEPYISIDQNGGNDFIAGSYIQHILVPGGGVKASPPHAIRILGNMVVALAEGGCSGSEDLLLACSSDGGTSMNFRVATQLGGCLPGTTNIDVDDGRLAVTLNGDICILYVDERIGNNNNTNALFATGLKYPALDDRIGTTGDVVMEHIDPAEASISFALLMLSATGTVPGTPVLPNDFGFYVGLTEDSLYHTAFDNILFLAPVTASNEATFLLLGAAPIPPLSTWLGTPVYAAGVSFQYPDPEIVKSYTDPIILP